MNVRRSPGVGGHLLNERRIHHTPATRATTMPANATHAMSAFSSMPEAK
jgi:hypothetical protein